MKCIEKKDKYSARERTGPNVVKLENVRLRLLLHPVLTGASAEFLWHLFSLLGEL